MPSITVKNIPDHTYKLLKQAAATNYRSINSEIIRLIEQATLCKPFHPKQHLATAKRSREKTKNFFLSPDILQASKEDGRS